MSLGYAEKLSFREDLGGQLGAPELSDTPEEVEAKVERLAELVRSACGCLVGPALLPWAAQPCCSAPCCSRVGL